MTTSHAATDAPSPRDDLVAVRIVRRAQVIEEETYVGYLPRTALADDGTAIASDLDTLAVRNAVREHLTLRNIDYLEVDGEGLETFSVTAL